MPHCRAWLDWINHSAEQTLTVDDFDLRHVADISGSAGGS